MNISIKKMLTITLALVTLLFIQSGKVGQVKAAELPTESFGIMTTFTEKDGTAISSGVQLSFDDYYLTSWTVNLGDSVQILAGDTITLSVPYGLFASHDDQVAITDSSDGQVVAQASVNRGLGLVTLAFNDYYSLTKTAGRSFTLSLSVVMNAQVVSANKDFSLRFYDGKEVLVRVSGHQITMSNTDIPVTQTVVDAWGGVDADNNNLIWWETFVSPATGGAKVASVVAGLSLGQAIDPSTVTVYRLPLGTTRDTIDFNNMMAEPPSAVSATNQALTVSAGDLYQPLYIRFATQVVDTSLISYSNTVEFLSDGTRMGSEIPVVMPVRELPQPAPTTYQLGGFTWVDENSNGLKEEAERVLPKVPVTLFDSSGMQLSTALTNDLGQYVFVDLADQTNYRIDFTLPENYQATTDTSVPITINATNHLAVNAGFKGIVAEVPSSTQPQQTELVTAQTVQVDAQEEQSAPPQQIETVTTQIDQVDTQEGLPESSRQTEIITTQTVSEVQPTVKLAGHLFEDKNANNIMDVDEKGLANLVVLLLSESGSEVVRVMTGENGEYSFEELAANAVFKVKFPQVDGFKHQELVTVSLDGADNLTINHAYQLPLVQTAQDNDFETNDGQPETTTSSESAATVEYYDYEDYAYSDTNSNGIRDEGEPTLGNWLVRLYENDREISQVTTDQTGYFKFYGLVRGNNYHVDATSTTIDAPASETQTTQSSYIDLEVDGAVAKTLPQTGDQKGASLYLALSLLGLTGLALLSRYTFKTS